MWDLALAIFIMPIAVGWWANWYPGAEPGGGSYIAQRMLASKSEKDSLGGTLFFNLAHYVLRPWPWIITALCSIIVFPELKDIQAAFPGADPALIGHDSAFPGDADVPAGRVRRSDGRRADRRQLVDDPHAPQLGLVVSRARFLSPVHHAGRQPRSTTCTPAASARSLLYVVAGMLGLMLESAQGAFQIIISIGAGTGLLYLLRWFWWRINAWCEVVAMISSFGDLDRVLRAGKSGLRAAVRADDFHIRSRSRRCAGWWPRSSSPQTDRDDAASPSTERCIPPARAGRRFGARPASARRTPRASGDHMGMATLGWVSGCARDLVVAVRDRQLSLRAHGARLDADGRVHRQRRDAAVRHQTPVGPTGTILTRNHEEAVTSTVSASGAAGSTPLKASSSATTGR